MVFRPITFSFFKIETWWLIRVNMSSEVQYQFSNYLWWSLCDETGMTEKPQTLLKIIKLRQKLSRSDVESLTQARCDRIRNNWGTPTNKGCQVFLRVRDRAEMTGDGLCHMQETGGPVFSQGNTVTIPTSLTLDCCYRDSGMTITRDPFCWQKLTDVMAFTS